MSNTTWQSSKKLCTQIKCEFVLILIKLYKYFNTALTLNVTSETYCFSRVSCDKMYWDQQNMAKLYMISTAHLELERGVAMFLWMTI